ncbi:MAG: hypothetical protein RI922_1335 [Bacteroidota bacterium]|jgi:hypothetical protein
MKKVYIIGLFSLASLAVNAQKVNNEYKSRIADVSAEYKSKPVSEATEKVIIWSNDFSNAAQWNISNNTADLQDWIITNASNTTAGYNTGTWTETAITVSNENGYALFDSDAVGSNGGTQDAFITTATPIDLSAYSHVVLEFAQRLRIWQTTETIIEISNDGGTTWSQFPINVGRPVSVPYEEIVSVNITNDLISGLPAAGGQSSVLVRFRYIGSWDYAWMVDDVRIIDQPADDVKNSYAYIAGVNNEGIEYGRTPLDQVDDSYEVGGNVVNFGVNDQTNVQVVADFGSFSSNFSLGTVISGDTIAYSNVETPTLAVGTYNGVYTVTSTAETAGTNFANNTSLRNFAITDNVYSQDGIGIHPAANQQLSSFGSESFSEPADTYLATMYHLRAATNLVSGFEIAITSSTVAGAEVQISIVDTASFLADALTPFGDLNGNTAESDIFEVAQGHIDAGIIAVAFPQPISLPAGAYYAVVRPMNTSGSTPIRVFDDQSVPQPWYASMVNIPDPTATSYSNGNAFAIRLKMGDQASVNEIEGLSSVAVYPNPAASSTNVAIELTNEADVAITVTDLSGKVVYSNALGTVNGTQNVTINTDAISSGAYMVNVSVNGTVSTQKLIVRK